MRSPASAFATGARVLPMGALSAQHSGPGVDVYAVTGVILTTDDGPFERAAGLEPASPARKVGAQPIDQVREWIMQYPEPPRALQNLLTSAIIGVQEGEHVCEHLVDNKVVRLNIQIHVVDLIQMPSI